MRGRAAAVACEGRVLARAHNARLASGGRGESMGAEWGACLVGREMEQVPLRGPHTVLRPVVPASTDPSITAPVDPTVIDALPKDLRKR